MLFLTNYSSDFSCTINSSSTCACPLCHNSSTAQRCGRECESVTARCLAAVNKMKTTSFNTSSPGTRLRELTVASAYHTSAFGNKIYLLIKINSTLSQKCHGMYCIQHNRFLLFSSKVDLIYNTALKSRWFVYNSAPYSEKSNKIN